MADYRLLHGDCLALLPTLPAGSVHCCISSPPYFGLRAYLKADDPARAAELGAERTPAEYVARLVAAFREVRRVLHPTGTVWLNLAGSYAAGEGVCQFYELRDDLTPEQIRYVLSELAVAQDVPATRGG